MSELDEDHLACTEEICELRRRLAFWESWARGILARNEQEREAARALLSAWGDVDPSGEEDLAEDDATRTLLTMRIR